MISKKRLASCHRRSLNTMREKVLVMANQWRSIDIELMIEMEKFSKYFLQYDKKLSDIISGHDMNKSNREMELLKEVTFLRAAIKRINNKEQRCNADDDQE